MRYTHERGRVNTPWQLTLLPKRMLAFALALVFILSLLAGSAAALVPVNGGTASTPVSGGGVTPYIIDGANPGGNRTCVEVGTAFFGDADYYEFTSERVNNENGVFAQAFPAGLTVTTDGTYVEFDSSFAIGAVIVKGSNDANIYVYEPQVKSDSGLASPVNPSNGSAGLSNITFCWNPEEEEELGQWCSPGYWRQPHHLDSWQATDYNTTDLYSVEIGETVTLSKKGLKDNAPTDPTLLQVLQNPQWYGGDAFNKVGDLLSTSHPDVNFQDERVEDSCPLN